jgi:hypothetical protein
MQTKAPCDDGTSKRGDLYFESGKDACMSANVKHCTYFLFCCRKNPQCSLARLGTKKKERKKGRIIELIITENHGCDLGTGRR